MTVDQLTPGTVVGGRYVIDGFLAQGGFASVYRAHHQEIGRRLAIKVLDPPTRNQADAFRQRFLSEAKIAARIEHPGVVSVFDFGMLDDGRAFIAMDLLDGRDLETELEGGPLDAARLLPMFTDCLAALAEGHRQGIVHKDLKPSNLFIVRPGTDGERLVVLDFGIARSFDDPGARITQEGGFAGTPAYLAPEYIRHQAVSPALDVYQMGLILIEALTGAQAIHAESSMGYLLAHCLEPVRLPTSLLDTKLGEICLRAVSKDPDLRYADAEAFRAALLDVPRRDLVDTRRFVVSQPVPQADRELAKTLQMIPVSPEALDQLSGPLPAPDIAVEEEDDSPPVALIAVALALTLCVAIALAFVFLGGDAQPPEPATIAPSIGPATVEPFAIEPVVALPTTDAGDVPADIGSPDLGLPDMGAPDLSPKLTKPRPPRKPPTPRLNTRPTPTEAKKPAKPLLLSP